MIFKHKVQQVILPSILIIGLVDLSYGEYKKLETVTISGNQIDEISPYDFIGSHQSLSSENFNQSFTTLPSLLEQQTGIEIQSIGGIGQYSSPVIRGSTGQQVLVFWDGMLLNNLGGGSADIGSLNLALANKIDIYRSLAPAELSASAVGGVIHIQSEILNKETNSTGTATATHGSYDTNQYSLSQNFHVGDTQWLIAASYNTANNDYEYYPSLNYREKFPRYNNGSDQKYTLLKGQRSFSDQRIDFSYQYSDTTRELAALDIRPNNQSNISESSHTYQLRWRKSWNSEGKIELISAISNRSELYDDQLNNIGLGSQLNQYDNFGKKFQFNLYSPINKVSTFFSIRHATEEIDSQYKLLSDEELARQCSSGKGCETTYKRTQNDISGRIQYSNDARNHILQVSHINMEDDNLVSATSHNAFKGTTWSLGNEFLFNSNFHLFLNFASQIRLPSTNEVFSDRGITKGNPDLLPEKSKHLEIGLNYAASNIEWQTSGYIREINDAIVAEPGGQGVIRYGNLGKTLHMGIEQSLSWKPAHFWSLDVNATVQSNEIIAHDVFPYFEGNQAPGYSQFYSYIATQFTQHNWDLKLSYTLELEAFADSSNLIAKDDKKRIDATIGINIEQWRFSLDGYDLTNNAAQDYPDYPEPGRMYFLRAQTQW